jgi:Domain of unknown function (DUF2760)
MGRFGLAFRAFFRILGDKEIAARVKDALTGPKLAAPAPPVAAPRAEPPRPAPPAKPKRSDALTLLSTLQREARFLDFIKEPIADYPDAQIGAVVRDIHRDCGAAIERLFALRPVLSESEGASVQIPENADAGRYRFTGKVTDRPHGSGRLVHHGWEATQCEVPAWTGSDAAAKIVAPAEVELT